MAKPALGRGLGALLGGITPAAQPERPRPMDASASHELSAGQRIQTVPLERIQRCPFQPRKDFSEESLRELADSIREQGILQPLVVRRRGDQFELIAGERRWRAAQLAGLAEAPVMIRAAEDREVLQLALIENLQRENLNPIDEARGYKQLIEQFQLRQEEAAGKVGKSRAVVANSLRLLRLPQEVQEQLAQGALSVGHAKAILGLADPEQQKRAADRVLKEGLNVRQTEALIAHWQKTNEQAGPVIQQNPAGSPGKGADMSDLENRMQQRLGTKVQLRYRQGKGSVEIRFYSDADLERILELLGVELP